MLVSEDTLIDMGVAALSAALFCYWQRKRLKVLWKRRKAVLRVLGILVMLAMLVGVDAHIIVGRLIVMGGLLSFWMVWKRRHKEAKGKQRRIAYIPKKGIPYVPRQRSENTSGDDQRDILAHNSAHRDGNISAVLADEASEERSPDPQPVHFGLWKRWFRKDESGAASDRRDD